jgi:hypothetical protein
MRGEKNVWLSRKYFKLTPNRLLKTRRCARKSPLPCCWSAIIPSYWIVNRRVVSTHSLQSFTTAIRPVGVLVACLNPASGFNRIFLSLP